MYGRAVPISARRRLKSTAQFRIAAGLGPFLVDQKQGDIFQQVQENNTEFNETDPNFFT